jgi:hypothetical protein
MSRNTHLLIVAPLAAALSFGVFAAEGSRPPANADKRQDSQSLMKQRALDYIDAKIRILQTAKACVRAAADMKAMAICYEQERQQTKALKAKAKEQARAGMQQQKPPPQPASAR